MAAGEARLMQSKIEAKLDEEFPFRRMGKTVQ
jgi:hypothetical protein